MAQVEDVPNSWAVDGVPLITKAYAIKTYGGNRQSPPPLRGTNATIPYRPGKLWLPKVADERSMTLEFFVVGMNPDGSVPDAAQQLFQFNYRFLRAALWTPGRQIQLSKQLKVDGAVRTVTALAQYATGLDLTMHGNAGAEFSVDLLLADPYFYSAWTPHQSGAITVEGEAPTSHVQVAFGGNGTILQSNGVSITNNGGGALTAFVETGVATNNGTGFISHSGTQQWFPLNPGNTTVSGPGTVSYQAAWL